MSREDQMVVIERDEAGTPTVWCDPEIVDLVTALNAAGLKTVASCSGHGHRPGRISLADGRELIIARDYDEARRIEALFPLNINGEPIPSAVSGDAGEAMSKRTLVLCVSGKGPTPYLEIHFANLADAHAAHNELLGIKEAVDAL